MNETIVCRSPSATKRLARRFAQTLKQSNGAVILFTDAPMGAGKTTFTSAVVAALNPKAAHAASPTFTIINQYAENIFHIDLYRIEDEQELANTDFDDIISANNFVFIEWSGIISRKFMGKVFQVSIEPIDDTTRRFTITEDAD